MLIQQCFLCSVLSKTAICDSCDRLLPTTSQRCLCCAIPLNIASDYCGICLIQTPIINRTYALYDYDGAMPYLIEQFKYNHKLFIGRFFAHKIYTSYQAIIRHNKPYDIIVPMPLHKNKIKTRGFNQVTELLMIINKNYNIVNTDICSRQKNTPTFAKLNLKDRKKHIKNAFSANKIQHNKILLVDDIITSGSSINELAKTIKIQNPTATIDAICLARTRF